MAQPLHFHVRHRPIVHAQSSSTDNSDSNSYCYPSRYAFGSASYSSGTNKENLGPRGSTDLSPITSEDEDEDNESLTPINPRTWAKEPPSFLQNGTLLPAARRPVPRSGTQATRDSTAPQPPSHDGRSASQGLGPDCDQFLRMMDDKLHLGSRRPTPGAEYQVAHVRSTSSSYPSPGDTSTRVQSPDSVMRPNRLSITDLSRITQTNGRLSILRSSSSLSDRPTEARAPGAQDVLAESSSAIAQWQKELRLRPSSYRHYELSDSAEVLPSDSLSEQRSPSSAVSPKNRLFISPSLTWESLRAIRAQYDGVHEMQHPALRPDPQDSSPAPFAVPSYAADNPERPSKRKASYFSLRSLSIKSLTKRPRLGLRRWANNVYQQGSHRLRVARQKFREQAEMDRRAFEAWRARRHRHDGSARAESPKSPKSGVGFPQRKNDEWWRDGVSRFEAPKWMSFFGGNSTSSRHGY